MGTRDPTGPCTPPTPSTPCQLPSAVPPVPSVTTGVTSPSPLPGRARSPAVTPTAHGAMAPVPRQPRGAPALAVPSRALRAGSCPAGACRDLPVRHPQPTLPAGRAPGDAAEPEAPRGPTGAQRHSQGVPCRAGPGAATVREEGRKEGRKRGALRAERGAPTPSPGTLAYSFDTRGISGAAPTPRRRRKESHGQAGAAGRAWQEAAAGTGDGAGRRRGVCSGLPHSADPAPARGSAPQPGRSIPPAWGGTHSLPWAHQPGDTNLGTPPRCAGLLQGHRPGVRSCPTACLGAQSPGDTHPARGVPPWDGGLSRSLPRGTAPGGNAVLGRTPTPISVPLRPSAARSTARYRLSSEPVRAGASSELRRGRDMLSPTPPLSLPAPPPVLPRVGRPGEETGLSLPPPHAPRPDPAHRKLPSFNPSLPAPGGGMGRGPTGH